MKRLSALTVCLCIAAVASAAPDPGKDQPRMLDVEPAAAPVPALKYQLLPEVAEMNPGNAVPAYLKSFAEQNNFFFRKESVEERERLLKVPLSDIKPGSLKGYGGSALRQADHAARLEYADWNTLPQMREHGYMLLIPEVQQMRMLANALVVRGRGQIVDRDFDGAVRTLKTIFAMARHMGEHPTIIAGLVGVAITQLGANLVEEMAQQPGAPNLYWALTGLPNPLVELRRGGSAERMMVDAGIGRIADRTRVWTPDEMPAVQQRLKELASILELPAKDRQVADQWQQDRVKDAEWLAGARKGLVAAGYPEDAVGRYPPEQVVFHHLHQKSRVAHDEALKWLPVPYHQAAAALAELDQVPTEIEEKLAKQLVFSISKVKAAHARLDQRLGLLRTAEAIRLEAAKNGGKLPTSLSDLSVPVPVDPVSGKPFEYKVDGMTAVLGGRPTPISGGKSQRYRYEIRLRK